jgi:hypothetical protein
LVAIPSARREAELTDPPEAIFLTAPPFFIPKASLMRWFTERESVGPDPSRALANDFL